MGRALYEKQSAVGSPRLRRLRSAGETAKTKSRALCPAFSTADRRLPTADSLAAHLHERLEDVERKLFGVDDIAEVMQRRAPLFHVIDVKVVLAQQVMGFLFRHSCPLSG
jgi:hypothetical protein